MSETVTAEDYRKLHDAFVDLASELASEKQSAAMYKSDAERLRKLVAQSAKATEKLTPVPWQRQEFETLRLDLRHPWSAC